MQLRQHEAIKSKGDQFRVDPRALKVEPGFNVRDLTAPTARESLDELKESVRSGGVQVPLEIRMKDDELYVVSGHRRLAVVMELIGEGVEIASVPAIAEPKIISEAERVARLVTLNQGEPLTSLEKAEVVRRLIVYGWERPDIARRLGFRSVQTVANLEMLLAAPAEIRDAVREGEIAATEAVNIVRADGDAAPETLAKARATAKAAGKTKITRATIAPKPRPQRQPKADETMRSHQSETNERRQLLDALPEGPQDSGVVSYHIKVGDHRSAVQVALAMLIKACPDLSPADVAETCDGIARSEVTPIIEWLMELESALRPSTTAVA